ncbi:unnamed protein product [Peronospora belbahrii]|nr:unnamed protein product [Peronospora belbahrii]
MERLSREQQTRQGKIAPDDRSRIPPDCRSCIPDIEMESVGSRGRRLEKYDPDDLFDLDDPRRPLIATAEAISSEEDLLLCAPDVEKCLDFSTFLRNGANLVCPVELIDAKHMEITLGKFYGSVWGYGLSTGRHYYYAWNQSDETPVEYLYRLNVAGMREKVPVQDGSPNARHADVMEETLRAYQRKKSRQGEASIGSSKFRQQSATPPNPTSSKPACAV